MSQNKHRQGHGISEMLYSDGKIQISLYQETAENKRKSGQPQRWLIAQIYDGAILARKSIGMTKPVADVIKLTAEFVLDWSTRKTPMAVSRCEDVLL